MIIAALRDLVFSHYDCKSAISSVSNQIILIARDYRCVTATDFVCMRIVHLNLVCFFRTSKHSGILCMYRVRRRHRRRRRCRRSDPVCSA